jgi:uncharacterized protein (TIGR02646 family)
MQDFFTQPIETRAQKRYEFDTKYLWAPDGEVRLTLIRLFHNKCAYCETPLVGQRPNLEHFRPKANARNTVRGTVDPDHYWWLFYEWENLYLACQECNINKRDQFPILGDRAKIGAGGAALREETAMLLDPCLDNPAEFLMFEEDGTVLPWPLRDGGIGRAETTIETLGLNREPLVAARQTAARETLALLESGSDYAVLNHMLQPQAAYSAVRQAVFGRFVRARGSAEWPPEQPGRRRPRMAAIPAPAAAPSTPPVGIQTTYVTRVEIRNFRAIRDLALEFHPQGAVAANTAAPTPEPAPASTDRVGWKVLLGENGSGKSSVVQAICIALAGEQRTRRWLKGHELLRRPGDGETAPKHGSVTLHLSRGEVIAFEIEGRKVRFTSGAEGAGTFLRAYGATRLLPSPRKRTVPAPRVVQIENLFDPFVPLHHASRWLAGLPQDRFDKAARTLKDLLRIHKDLSRDARGNVLVPDASGAPMPLHHLSDGYQTVIALAVDIMAGLPEQEMDYRSSPGIVLLDELGTHLHPRWRMVIVESLRNAFSSMQFIATTHEPLCLRGLREGEIAVMRRDGDDIGVMTDLPSPEKLRIDQLLTSPFFGLHTTIDPEVDRRFQEYYDLLATPGLSPELEERRERLRADLSGFGVLGYTRRDQLMYEVVDRYLAKAQKNGKSLTTLPLSAKKELVQIWRRVGALREAPR